MRPFLIAIAALAILGPLTQRVHGLGDETVGNEPLGEANYTDWKGIMPLVNDKARVYSSWVNGNEHFFYKGATADVNAALANFAKVEVDKREVLLRPGPGIGRRFGGEAVPHNWDLHVHGGISKHLLTLDQGKEVWNKDPRLTIYVGGDIDLAKLEIPAGLTLIDIPSLSKRVASGITASKDKTVRGWGCGELAALDHYSADNLQVIGKMVEDADSWVRLNAAGSLPKFGKQAAPYLAALRESLSSEDANLKTRAQAAIAEIEQAKDNSTDAAAFAGDLKKIGEFVEAWKRLQCVGVP